MLEKIHKLHGDSTARKWGERIISQLRFAYILSKASDNKYDDLIKRTEEFVCEAVEKQGAFTKDIVHEAEGMLSPVAPAAKEYQILCVAHAHIDMNWMWGYEETVAVVVDTFRTMLDIMDEIPSYKFSQSQASVYQIVEEHYPDMLEEIKQRVKEGRWEITASSWVECDTNMPSGESLARQILYTKQYLSALFDTDPDSLNILFQPDTFGHSINLPELLSQAGVDYYYHCRGKKDGAPLFRWQSPSGADIVVYKEHNFYNAFMGTEIAEQAVDLAQLTSGNKTILKVYGVGDHGGGPSRRDINRILDMNSWPVYPAFKCSTFKEYFESVETVKHKLPIEVNESNFVFDGCYTSQSIIKQGNRVSERLLNETELISAFSSLSAEHKYDNKGFVRAWQKVLFNQFHDILTGSCVQASREFAVAEYQKVAAIAVTNKKQAVKAIIDNIDTSLLFEEEDITVFETQAESAGAGNHQNSGGAAGKNRIFHIFNTASFEKSGLCEILVWDYEGDFGHIHFKDSSGNPCSFQIENQGNYWGHTFTKIFVEVTVPACGYETIVLYEQIEYKFDPNYTFEIRTQEEYSFVLENEKIKVTFNAQNAAIDSFIDKESGEKLINNKLGGGGFRFIEENGGIKIGPFSGMSSWFVGRYKNVISLHRNMEIKHLLNGELRNAIQFSTVFNNSTLTVVASLDKDSSHLDFEVSCDWREFGTLECVPALGFYLPLAYNCDKYLFDVPFGVIERRPLNIDQPANNFVRAISGGKKELMLISKTKYGYRCYDNAIGLNLLRSSTDPDKTPEIGSHKMEFCINAIDASSSRKQSIDTAYEYCHSLQAFCGKWHTGTMPAKREYLREIDGSAAISSIKMSENGKSLIIRLYEIEGKNGIINLQFFSQPKSVCFVDVTEKKEQEGIIGIDGNTIAIPMTKYHLATVKVDF